MCNGNVLAAAAIDTMPTDFEGGGGGEVVLSGVFLLCAIVPNIRAQSGDMMCIETDMQLFYFCHECDQ